MKAKLILSIISVILSLVSYLPVRAQSIIRTETGDTLITITPSQLRTINCAFSDLRLEKERGKLQGELITSLEKKLIISDSINLHLNAAYELQKEVAERNLKVMEEQIKRERQARYIKGGLIGCLVGLVVGIIATRN